MSAEGISPEQYDKQLDHIVDTQNVSYAAAREILGHEPGGPDSPAAIGQISIAGIPISEDIELAYERGTQEMEHIDPEVAEDLGIPMSPESVNRHLNSAQQVLPFQETPLSPVTEASLTLIENEKYRNRVPKTRQLFHEMRERSGSVTEFNVDEFELLRAAAKNKKAKLTKRPEEM